MDEDIFNPWIPGRGREQFPGALSSGAYILALYEKAPTADIPADPIDEMMIYIGETTRNTLIGRWRQFDRTEFSGGVGGPCTMLD
jgi:hypothetical protein